ncbi:MAG TPA: TIGR03013 family PEP-CTERM/XrtA system glycosyltransferase [Vicinamibacterales bacterium]|nr:TIGR03013 family PEP-CTERM/XrtA system glycosyltransferase [Vicinamibacterales bacterium]
MQGLLTGSFSARWIALVLVEHALIVLSMLLAAVVRLGAGNVLPLDGDIGLLWRAILVAVVLQVCLHYCDLYDLRTLADRRDLFTGLLRALGATSVILAILYFLVPDLVIGRGVVAVASVLIIGLVVGWRMAFEWLSLRRGPTERLLIVGTGGAAVTLAREIFQRRSELGVEIVGFVDSDPTMMGAPMINPGVVGTISDIPEIVRDREVDRVVVSLADARGKLNMDELLDMKLNQGVRFDHLASVYEQYTGKIAVENLRPSWMIFSEGFRKSASQAAVKRIFDVVLAVVGLSLAAPIMAMVALSIRMTSPGPVLYSQRRVGKDGQTFTIHKFRSMQVDAEAATGAVWAQTGDPRVTPVGRILRRTRLDEIPQLWNVLVGDMSFVGPRPERPEFVADLRSQIPFYGQRHVVRPGVTGWAQVRHRYGASVDDALQKLQYDLYYIKHQSIAFDIFIVVETIKTVLVRGGS